MRESRRARRTNTDLARLSPAALFIFTLIPDPTYSDYAGIFDGSKRIVLQSTRTYELIKGASPIWLEFHHQAFPKIAAHVYVLQKCGGQVEGGRFSSCAVSKSLTVGLASSMHIFPVRMMSRMLSTLVPYRLPSKSPCSR